MQKSRVILLSIAAVVAVTIGACSKDSDGSSSSLDRGSCYVLIECAGQISPQSQAGFEDAYGPLGTCWQAGISQWQQCRDACAMSLDALNQVGMVNGETCGTCTLVGDCASFGEGAYCDQGLCAGGSAPDDDHDASETTGDGDPTTGDGDGDPTTGDGDGDPTTGDGDGDPTTGDGDPTTGDGDGDPTTGDGDGDPQATCGWFEDPNVPGYYCGGMGEDPSGTNPYSCPDGLFEGAPCGTVTGAGCCDADGNNWYCGQDDQANQFLVLETCS